MADYLRTKPMAITGAIMAIVQYIWTMAVGGILTTSLGGIMNGLVVNIITLGVMFGVVSFVYNKVQSMA